ncbi:MAG TPA: acetyl-CoA carboxylase biotin carboxyl carrier protein [Aestuariivirga sp.]
MAVKKKPNAPVAPETGELSLIRKLAQILNETGLTEIELDHKGAKVRVAKMMQAAAVVHAAPAMVHTAAAKPMAAAAPIAVEEVAGTPLKSPMVGTAYLLPSPESPPFVTVGSSVKEGQTVLIIEAMKTMNQIVAPKAGKVVKINVENAQPVEYGEVLMVIE